LIPHHDPVLARPSKTAVCALRKLRAFGQNSRENGETLLVWLKVVRGREIRLRASTS